jgi:hypothetical protein
MKPQNYVAKDLRTPKYRIRVAESRKRYNRKNDKQIFAKEMYAQEKR